MKINKETKKELVELLNYVENTFADWHEVYGDTAEMSNRLYNDEPIIGAMKMGYALSDLYFLTGQYCDKAKEMACRARNLLDELEKE